MLITFAIMKFVNLEYSALLRGKGKFEASSKARNDVITFFKNKYKKLNIYPYIAIQSIRFLEYLNLCFSGYIYCCVLSLGAYVLFSIRW